MNADEIIKALRCTSTPGGPTEDCGKCPFCKTENLTHEQAEQLGEDKRTSCDVDRVGMAAADRLANDQTHIAALQKEIEKLRSGRRWIPVTERLPGNGERVLAYCKDRVIHDVKWSWPQNAWFDKVTGHEYFESFATHWMPLPEPPEED